LKLNLIEEGLEMPRRTRIDAPGALHHVIVRGIERRVIFRDDRDRDDFLKRLSRLLSETETSCYAWVLIPNHFHLLLRSGTFSLSTFMRRLLTGYAVSFNHRYKRHGHLFQNRYKSILCQEEPYLLELVRYIHLNPIKAGLVKDLAGLEAYPYCGHGVLMGRLKHTWQDVDFVLGHFGKERKTARNNYRTYIAEGKDEKHDLRGGELIRRDGIWTEVKRPSGYSIRLKGDERILGDDQFIMKVIRKTEESLEKSYLLKNGGYDLKKVVQRVAKVMEVEEETIHKKGRKPHLVEARSVFCFWAVRELGMSVTSIARELKLTQPAVSIAVRRGEQIVKERGYELSEQ
jgi:REP element-mobilizing transposase RayT